MFIMIFGSEDKNSADLDKYYSVNFYNPPYGQMIMSSEVVKWLCRNRAKDYFEEMERVKHD